MARERTVHEKVGDFAVAYAAIKKELTSADMREMVTNMTSIKPADVQGDIQAYAALVASSVTVARVAAANDRTAAIVAGMLTQSGVARPVIDLQEDNE